MSIVFVLQSIFLASVVTIGRYNDVLFVVTMALVFFTWGELYVLFPAVLTDTFGARHAASNYGFLYSTKGVASILGGGLAAMLFEATHTWDYAFFACSALTMGAAVCAMMLRKIPLPKKRTPVETVAETTTISA